MANPIRIFHSGLTNTIYASNHYKSMGDGLFVSSSKDDVTQEAIAAVREHIASCERDDCGCAELRNHTD